MNSVLFSRRACLTGAAALLVAGSPRESSASATAFEPRGLRLRQDDAGCDASVLATISRELERRTSAAVVREPSVIEPASASVLASPFLFAGGTGTIDPLSEAAQRQLQTFFSLGGLLVVDDRDRTSNTTAYAKSVEHSLASVLPDAGIIHLTADHVLFRSFYLLGRIVGAKGSSTTVRAMARGNRIDVIFCSHDLSSALATRASRWALAMDESERELAVRFAVNLAMYSLCSTYKDDQVHAPFLMRRRAGKGFPR